MAPSRYLKQYGLIIKLINKVPWHLYQWIIIKDLKIPISKMRQNLVLWDNFASSPEITHFILFSSDNCFVLCHRGKLIFIVTIFNPSDCCLLKGNKVPSPCAFCDHTTGGQCSKNLKQPCCTRSQSHGRLWHLLKLKFGNFSLNSKSCGTSCKNSIPVFNSNSKVFNSNSIFNSTNFNSNSGIGIGIELQFQFRTWIDSNPATCPHNTPHIPSCYNNEQTNKKSSKQLLYIHISCKCDANRAGHFTLDAHASRPVACPCLMPSYTISNVQFSLKCVMVTTPRSHNEAWWHSWTFVYGSIITVGNGLSPLCAKPLNHYLRVQRLLSSWIPWTNSVVR